MKIVGWKCLECGSYLKGDESLKDGTRCQACKGMLEPIGEPLGITVKVSIKDLKPFKRIVNILGEFILDERMPEAIRMEYASKIIRLSN